MEADITELKLFIIAAEERNPYMRLPFDIHKASKEELLALKYKIIIDEENMALINNNSSNNIKSFFWSP